MKVVIMEPLEDGDVFVVRRVGSFLFSTRIEVEKLRSEDEINEIITGLLSAKKQMSARYAVKK